MIHWPFGFSPEGRTPAGWAGCINSQRISEGNITAVPRVGKMPCSQHDKDPISTAYSEWPIDVQLLRLNFPPHLNSPNLASCGN